jgi:hypothetical protein
MEYYAKQDRAYLADNTETPTPGYTLFDAGVGGDVTKKNGKVLCSIHLGVSNIFDIAYQSHLSRLKYFEPYPNNPSGRSGIYDIGRNITLSTYEINQYNIRVRRAILNITQEELAQRINMSRQSVNRYHIPMTSFR